MLKTKLLFFGIRLFVFIGLTTVHNAPYPHIPISFYISSLRWPLGGRWLHTSSLRRSPSCSILIRIHHRYDGHLSEVPLTRIHHRYGGRLVALPFTRRHHHCDGRLSELPLIRTHRHYDHRLSACLLPMPGVKYQRSGR